MAYSQVDLSALPAPNIVERLDYEAILDEMKAACIALMPSIEPVLQLESESANKVLQVAAAYVLMIRAEINDGAKAVLLAYATGSDLDHIGALYGVERAIIQEENEDDEEVLEDDDSFRSRIQIAPEGFSVAGPRGAYEFHALSADADVKDVAVIGPGNPSLPVPSGHVHLYVLSATGDGTADPALLEIVGAAVNAEDVRPLTDTVTVSSATVAPFDVTARIEMLDGPDTGVVLEEAQAALTEYLDTAHALGATVAISGIHGALHRPGVRRVVITAPVADIIAAPNVAPFATTVTITVTE